MQRATTQNQDNQDLDLSAFILLDNLGQINEIKSEHTKNK